MSTLYRKYRPQLFSEIHDQEHIVKTITNEIAGNKIAHAYLFTGSRGVGKTTIARLLAKALNCKNRKENSFEPCNECSSCTEITAGRNIDVIEIDAASHTGVDNVRENIIENAQFKPTQSKFKIFIIDEVHMLTINAFNALLKTIEEPPAHVIFILATTELHKLPATIISRCQRFAFKKITREGMMEKMEGICKAEKIKVQKSVLEKIINKSEGGMRDAESLLGQILNLNLKEITDQDIESILPSSDLNSVVSFAQAIADGDGLKAVEQIEQQATAGANLEQFILDLIEVLRAAMIATTGYEIKNLIEAEKETLQNIKKISEQIPTQKIIALIDSALMRKREIKLAPIPQLPLELLAIQFSQANYLPPNVGDTQEESSSQKTEETKPKNFTDSIKTAIVNLTHKTVPKTTLEEIKPKWNEIIGGLSQKIPYLTFILKSCTLQSIDENGLNLSFQFEIHKFKVEEAKNRKFLEDEIEKIMGERIRIFCVTQSASTITEDDITLNSLATDFGGEVV